MEIAHLILHIEALIFASDKPLTAGEITELVNNAFGFMEDKIVVEQVDAALEVIVEKYSNELYPFEVRKSGGGWQFLTKKEYHKTVAQLNGEKFLKRLSAAALETLAIIAYKQPITKGEIELIRGVSADYAIQKLLEKELIVISGRNEQLPGHPLVYNTSKSFMDYFGINSPDDLPKIKEVLAEAVVEPTIVNHTELEQSETLSVSDNGELIGIEESEADQTEGAKLFLNGYNHRINDVHDEKETGGANDEPELKENNRDEGVDDAGPSSTEGTAAGTDDAFTDEKKDSRADDLPREEDGQRNPDDETV